MNISPSYNECWISINFWGKDPVVDTSWVWQVPVQSYFLFHSWVVSHLPFLKYSVYVCHNQIKDCPQVVNASSPPTSKMNITIQSCFRFCENCTWSSPKLRAKCPSSSKPKGPSPGQFAVRMNASATLPMRSWPERTISLPDQRSIKGQSNVNIKAEGRKLNSRLPFWPASSANKLACFWISSP